MMASSSETPVSVKESSTSPICPFSYHPLSAIPRDNLAIIYQCNPTNNRNYEGGCGHRCNLSRLVSYLHDNGGSAVCPSCRSRVLAVCDLEADDFLRRRRHFARDCDGNTADLTDGGSNEFLDSVKIGRDSVEENSENENRDGRIITFRYGSISYFLWVSSNLKGVGRGCAMERIGCVLNMDDQTGLKSFQNSLGHLQRKSNLPKQYSSGNFAKRFVGTNVRHIFWRFDPSTEKAFISRHGIAAV
mmetsp:Transcript_13174/g.27683  ORF Transcript_13174/g.27683 Transcript_13174/m.27683 type:complete len:245 (+) Transcript_13174:174-908(+)